MMIGLGLGLGLGARVSSSSEWAPSSVGTVLWDFDARNASTSGGVVTSVADASGNGYTATAPGGSEPTYTASDASYGGKPSIFFPAGGTKVLDTANGLGTAIGTNPVTIFLVGDCTAAAGTPYFLMTKSGGTLGFYARPGGPDWRAYATNDISFGAGITPGVIACVFGGAGTSTAYRNSTTGAVVAVGAHTVTAGMRVGNWQAAAGSFSANGSVTRILIYSGALSNANVGTAMTQLGSIYGITVS